MPTKDTFSTHSYSSNIHGTLLGDGCCEDSEEYQTHSPCPCTAYTLDKEEGPLEAMTFSMIKRLGCYKGKGLDAGGRKELRGKQVLEGGENSQGRDQGNQ